MAKRKWEFKYDVVNGRLKFLCIEWDNEDLYYEEHTGFVPDEIVKIGDEAIRQYVKSEIKKKKEIEAKELNARLKKIRATDFPIEKLYGGILLSGKIVDCRLKTNRSGITVLLEEPKEFAGQDHRTWGFAMRGKDFYDKKSNLTEYAVKKGEELLVEIYKKQKKEIESQKNAPVAYEVAKRLNKKK